MPRYGHYSSDSWLATEFGKKVSEAEQGRFDECAKGSFGYFGIQIGMPQLDLLRRCPINSLAKVGLSSSCAVRAAHAALPFQSDSIDYAAAAHALEFAGDPHGVLREIARVLRADGRLALAMFNPYSLVGLKSQLDTTGEFPNHGRMIPLAKIKDWLSLLDFRIEEGECAVYGTGNGSRRAGGGTGWVDHAGARWWPLMGSVIFLVARKRVIGMNVILPEWKRRPVNSRLAAAGQNGA